VVDSAYLRQKGAGTCIPTRLSISAMSHRAFTPQPQSITALWPVLISRPTEGRRLNWPAWLSEILRSFTRPKTVTHPILAAAAGHQTCDHRVATCKSNQSMWAEQKMERSGPKIEWAERWAGVKKIGWSRSGRSWSEEQRGEQTKLAAQISLKGNASLLKLAKSLLPDVKNKLSTGILLPISNRR